MTHDRAFMRGVLTVIASSGLSFLACMPPVPVARVLNTTTTGFGRLDVTPVLQDACRGFASDVEIDGLITAFETDRLGGFSLQTMVNGIFPVCQDSSVSPSAISECTFCALAIAGQVYGL